MNYQSLQDSVSFTTWIPRINRSFPLDAIPEPSSDLRVNYWVHSGMRYGSFQLNVNEQ